MESSRTLVLQDVVAELMAATGQSDELCKAFVKSLFTAVGDQLVANGEATLKGIGRFVVCARGRPHRLSRRQCYRYPRRVRAVQRGVPRFR